MGTPNSHSWIAGDPLRAKGNLVVPVIAVAAAIVVVAEEGGGGGDDDDYDEDAAAVADAGFVAAADSADVVFEVISSSLPIVGD